MQEVAATLAERHGDSFLALANPAAPGVDRTKVCAVAIDLYDEVVALPKEDAGRLLRLLFAQ